MVVLFLIPKNLSQSINKIHDYSNTVSKTYHILTTILFILITISVILITNI